MSLPRPKPKPSRKVDLTFHEQVVSRDGLCLAGLFLQDGRCLGSLEAHHLRTRGAGGDDDARNGITLCHQHHQMVHSGQIQRDQLETFLYLYHGVEALYGTSTDPD